MSGHRASSIANCIKRILKVTIHLPVIQNAAHRAAVIHQKVVAVHPVAAVHPVVAVRPVAAVHPAVKIIHQRKAVLQVHLLLTVNTIILTMMDMKIYMKMMTMMKKDTAQILIMHQESMTQWKMWTGKFLEEGQDDPSMPHDDNGCGCK